MHLNLTRTPLVQPLISLGMSVRPVLPQQRRSLSTLYTDQSNDGESHREGNGRPKTNRNANAVAQWAALLLDAASFL